MRIVAAVVMAGLSHTLDRFGLVWTILVSWVLKAGILKWFAIPFSVITHLEPDILECEVKWALGRITMNKASGGDGIPVELFKF